MSLFDGLPLDTYDVVSTRPAAKPAEIAYTVTIKRASNGEEILLCNVTPPPHGAVSEARQRKLPLFTLDEIPAMRQAAAADPGYIDILIATRRLMGWGGNITFAQEAA